MMRLLCLSAIMSLLVATASWAEPPVDGKKLVRELWNTAATKQWPQKVNTISPAFQSVHTFGARDKAQELALLDKVDFTKYVLSGFRTTRQGPLLVVTYLAKVEESVDGMRAEGKTIPRMSVFIKTDQGWQWLAHASVPMP